MTNKAKVFIDGSAGTTGLRIYERLSARDDIELIQLSDELRKDNNARKAAINSADVAFLCLPDAAAIEAVSFVDNPDTAIIDTSTAHRTLEGWTYGFPELDGGMQKERIKVSKRIANPGCYASGFIALVEPLVRSGIIGSDEYLSCFALTGYSGGGKKMIAEYESEDKEKLLYAPRQYGIAQQHKHLKEMKAITGLSREPLFSPIVCDYYSGMLVSLPLCGDLLSKNMTPEELHAFYTEYYAGEKFVKVAPFGAEAETRNFLGANVRSGWDGMEIFVTGCEGRLLVSSRFDNLGKGASGAAVQCLNIMLGCEEDKGLQL